MKRRLLFFWTIILCLGLAVTPAWADSNANANANAGAAAIASSGTSSSSATGGTSVATGGTSLAVVDDVRTGDSNIEIGVEAPNVSLTQTFEAADPWGYKGNAVLPGIASPNLMQQFVSGGIPLAERQDKVFQIMMALFPMEYTAINMSVRGESSIGSSSRRFKKHWWSRSSELRIPSVPFKTEVKTEHSTISATLHPWYRDFLSEDAWENPTTGEIIYPEEIGVESVRVVNTTLSGFYVPLGVVATSSRNPGDSPLSLTDDTVEYIQRHFKGLSEIVLFDPEIGRGAVSGSEANSKGGGISTAIANFATFNTLTGGASVGGSAGTVMPVSVYGKCFMVMASADMFGLEGMKINITNIPKKAEDVTDNENGGDGKKAVGSGVVK